MAAVARMEHAGVPIDVMSLAAIRAGWDGFKAQLIAEVDTAYGVFEGSAQLGSRPIYKHKAFHGRVWNRPLALDTDTFKDQTKSWPQLRSLHELRHTLGELRLEQLAIGNDNRNRTLLSPFGSRTGRYTPSNTKFVFGPAVWVRSLIKPEPGQAIAYVDFSSQEVGIAAALSGDEVLLEAYRSGDVYLAFARQAGLAPLDATKASHGTVRDQCKVAVLGTLYGLGDEALARKLGCRLIEARDLLRLHRQTYRRFWEWSEDVVASACATRRITTVFGWTLRPPIEANPRSLANFPMQANGAEMLRLACCLATEAGIKVCAPIHDALLIEAPVDRIETDVERLQNLMAETSRVVLADRLTIGADAKIVRWPDRYSDPRGASMWGIIKRLSEDVLPEVLRSAG